MEKDIQGWKTRLDRNDAASLFRKQHHLDPTLNHVLMVKTRAMAERCPIHTDPRNAGQMGRPFLHTKALKSAASKLN